MLGVFQPYLRGVFWNALVIIYVVTSVLSGYTSVSFYSQLEGTSWMKNLLLTEGIFSGPLFLTFGFLNSVAIFYRTSMFTDQITSLIKFRIDFSRYIVMLSHHHSDKIMMPVLRNLVNSAQFLHGQRPVKDVKIPLHPFCVKTLNCDTYTLLV